MQKTVVAFESLREQKVSSEKVGQTVKI